MLIRLVVGCAILVLFNPIADRLRAADADAKLNQLSATEKAAGWRLLFDGKTTSGWRSFKKDTFPAKGGVVEDGILKKVANVRGGDIITTDQFNDFDFHWDCRIAPQPNNAIK